MTEGVEDDQGRRLPLQSLLRLVDHPLPLRLRRFPVEGGTEDLKVVPQAEALLPVDPEVRGLLADDNYATLGDGRPAELPAFPHLPIEEGEKRRLARLRLGREESHLPR